MKLTEASILGAFVIEIDPLRDERGFFVRTFCRREMGALGLKTEVAQRSMSFNTKKGTLRGLHYQAAPHEETKIVRCLRGSLFDVIVDLRPGSPTHRQWFGVELSANDGKMLYIPSGLAHGFETLEDGTEVDYQMSVEHHPESARHDRG